MHGILQKSRKLEMSLLLPAPAGDVTHKTGLSILSVIRLKSLLRRIMPATPGRVIFTNKVFPAITSNRIELSF